MKLLSILFLLTSVVLTSSACTCDFFTYCDILHGSEDAIVVKAVVSNRPNYDDQELVGQYLNILETYRNDTNIDLTRLKILEAIGINYTTCNLEIRDRFTFPDTVYVAVKNLDWKWIENPTEDEKEDVFVIDSHICSVRTLFPYNENVYSGFVKGKRGEEDLIRFIDKDILERGLANCDFDLEEISEIHCAKSTFLIYPNPIVDGFFKVKTVIPSWVMDFDVVLINASGIEVAQYSSDEQYYIEGFDCSHLTKGFYFFRITCNEKVETYRIYVI